MKNATFKVLVLLIVVLLFVGCGQYNAEVVSVPNFVGMKASEAQNLAKNSGIILQVVATQPSETYPIDTIISQDPNPGTEVKKGGIVKIILSSGFSTITVPEAVNKDFKDARELIINAGLTLGEIKEVEVDAPVGTVIAQSPDPNTVVQPGTKVDLTVSIGTFVVVPNVIGKSVNEAKTILENAGLVLYKVDSFDKPVPNAPPKTVLYQYPMPNAKVQKGTQVLLRVSK
ncbi:MULTISPECIES: PASTA domain-containing protein [Caldisericum]|jgi:serine/threonine-protein kinase|uniref:PASTA domain-containing protein n=1 Tax=Caldisericum TaxID=693074 RepID=UPI003C711BD8